MTILVNPSRFRLGADTAVGRLLGEETVGLAVDFTANQALIRDDTSPLTTYFGSPASLLTYTSPATKWVCDVSGLLVSGTTLRTDHDMTTHAPLGLRMEMARINVVLHNRDLTQATWVKTSITAAKDQSGTDGVANSASSILATAANGTCLQTVTIAVNTRITSAYVKRLVGTGTIEATQDNGTTWTPITVTSAWTRVSNPSASVTNPVIGFRIATSGDKIAVDFVQNEIGTWATSPIATTTVAVTRAIDVVTLPVTAFPHNGAACTLFAAGTVQTQPAAANATGASFGDGTANNRIAMNLASNGGLQSNLTVTVGGVIQAGFSNMGTIALGSEIRIAFAGTLNSFGGVSNGGVALQTDAAGTMPTVTALYFGCTQAANEVTNGHIRRVKYLPRRATNAELQAMVA